MGEVALRLDGVSIVRDRRSLLADIDWVVGSADRWVVIGPNGSGKTTLLQIAGARLHPSRGSVEILGERLGRSDWRAVRARVGFVSGSVVRSLRPSLDAADIVVTGKYGALEPWWHTYTDADRTRALELMGFTGVAELADRPFGVISEGERQQVLLARLLMGEPGLMLLDEPFAGLDLGARERLLGRLSALATDAATPPIILVTHHVEEIPPGTTHALVIAEGRVVTSGSIADALTSEALSAAFDFPVELGRDGSRWSARAHP
ncbi:MAG: ABC transporter ATP-binding protein [Acidimicrobiia bacterium]